MTGPAEAEGTGADAEVSYPDTETRRGVLMLLADGDYGGVKAIAEETMPGSDPLAMMFQCVCLELMAVSLKHETETETDPGLKALGAMVGGLFGIETTAEDELTVDLHDVGARLLGRIRQLESSVRCAAGALSVVEQHP